MNKDEEWYLRYWKKSILEKLLFSTFPTSNAQGTFVFRTTQRQFDAEEKYFFCGRASYRAINVPLVSLLTSRLSATFRSREGRIIQQSIVWIIGVYLRIIYMTIYCLKKKLLFIQLISKLDRLNSLLCNCWIYVCIIK